MAKEALSDMAPELIQAQDQFILEWGRMSSSWGINRTMAQIHALLFVTGVPLEVNEIMQRHFAAPYPARSTVGVASLPRGAQFEVEAVLVLG